MFAANVEQIFRRPRRKCARPFSCFLHCCSVDSVCAHDSPAKERLLKPPTFCSSPASVVQQRRIRLSFDGRRSQMLFTRRLHGSLRRGKASQRSIELITPRLAIETYYDPAEREAPAGMALRQVNAQTSSTRKRKLDPSSLPINNTNTTCGGVRLATTPPR
jgi:hypothetical protein